MTTIRKYNVSGRQMKKFELAEVCQQDIGELSRIHLISFNEGWSGRMFERILLTTDNYGLVARDLRTWSIAGFVMLRIAADECEILSLAVAPEFRGEGVGGFILDGAMRKATALGSSSVFLEVAEDNHIAVGLYRSRDLVSVGRRPGYYLNKDGTRTAAVTMSRTLRNKPLEPFI